MARLFKQDIELTFVYWQERLRIISAIELLPSGQSIIRVALDMGYQSASSFTTAFTKVMGISPKQYMKTVKNS